MDKDKLTTEQQFYSDKTLEFAKELYDQSEEKLKEAYNGQIKNRDDLLSKIAKILLAYNIADNILKLHAAEKKKLYLELSDLVVTNVKKELNFETDLTKDILTNVGREKYNTNNYLYSLGANFKITQLDDKALDKIINTKVDDKLWSDRLYDNKNEMCNVLQTEVEKFLKGETNVNQIEQKIIEKYDTNAHETKRLVQDNICRVQEGANDQWQREHDIEYVMYMATLDGKVCHRCAQYDSKVYELDKKPVLIPRHPFCRCVYISLPNKDWHPKMRLDNETKKNINWQSYQEWKENYIDNNPERLINHKMIKNKSSDEKQHERYRKVLGDKVPEKLEDFQKIKYINAEKWSNVNQNYKINISNQARADKIFTNYAPEKVDVITTRNLYKELRKSEVGKETLEYLENNKVNVSLYYKDVPEDLRGLSIGKRNIEIYVPNTLTKVKTAQTIIHETTHIKYNIGHDKKSEVICFLREKMHINPELTIRDKRNTIELINKLYPEYPWKKE